jgi:hypothetical protein
MHRSAEKPLSPGSGHSQLLTGSDAATFGLVMGFDIDEKLLGKNRRKNGSFRIVTNVCLKCGCRGGVRDLSWPLERTGLQANSCKAACNAWAECLHKRFHERLLLQIRRWPNKSSLPLQDRQDPLWYCRSSIESFEWPTLPPAKVYYNPAPNELRIGEKNSHRSLGNEKFNLRWVHHELTAMLTAQRIVKWRKLLKVLRVNAANMFLGVTTTDESWYYSS